MISNESSFFIRLKTASSWTSGTSVVRRPSAPTGRTTTRTPTASSTSSTHPMRCDWRSALMSCRASLARTASRTCPCWFLPISKTCSLPLRPRRSWIAWRLWRSRTGRGPSKRVPLSPKMVSNLLIKQQINNTKWNCRPSRGHGVAC